MILTYCAQDCVFYKKEGKCQAFPKGIPDEIQEGEIEHNKVIEGQTGDFVFTSHADYLDQMEKDFKSIKKD